MTAAGRDHFRDPVDTGFLEIPVSIHRSDLAVDPRILLPKIRVIRTITPKKLAVAALVAGEHRRHNLARVPGYLTIRIDDQRVDAALGDDIDKALCRFGGKWPVLQLPELGRVGEDGAAIRVK